jgi:succinate dehydrogenase / fumarate reductase flavoprotein subunit
VVDGAGTVIPGLYAAGECACVSVHGANRLGTNSLLDIVVFGKRGGRSAVAYAAQVDQPELPAGAEGDVRERIERLKSSTGGEKVAAVRGSLQEQMQQHALVFRTEDGLASLLGALEELQDRYAAATIDDKGEVFNFDLTEALELGYLLDLAESLAVSARARTESRGAHFRSDHPTRDDAHWMRHTLVSRGDDGTVTIDYKPVVLGDYVPMERKY